MRPLTAITLAVLCVLELGTGPPTFAQQPNGPRQIVARVAPRYPDLARSMRLEGSVKVTVTVAPNGTVRSVQALGGHPLLIKAAQDALAKWKWAPSAQESTEMVELRFHPD